MKTSVILKPSGVARSIMELPLPKMPIGHKPSFAGRVTSRNGLVVVASEGGDRLIQVLLNEVWVPEGPSGCGLVEPS